MHAHIEHLFSLLEGAKKHNVSQVFIHFFSDGRDTSPTSGVTYLKQVLGENADFSLKFHLQIFICRFQFT